jgi:predicted TIM-barrel fold metal-dependent hydrolase
VNLVFSGAKARFPEIRFILSHAGGALPYLALRLELAQMIEASLQDLSRDKIAAGLKSFWYDNAIASGPQTMGALLHVTTQDHILFGSDWPFCDDAVVADEIARLNAPNFLAPDTIAMIARKNGLALFPATP